GLENILNAMDACVEPRVAGPPEILVHERDLIVRALSGEDRSCELEIVANRGRRFWSDLRVCGRCSGERECRQDASKTEAQIPPSPRSVPIRAGRCDRDDSHGAHGFTVRFMSSATAASSCGSLPVYHSPIWCSTSTSTGRG